MNDYSKVYFEEYKRITSNERMREDALEAFESKVVLKKFIDDESFSFKELTMNELKTFVLYDICDIYEKDYDVSKLVDDIGLENFLLCFGAIYPTSIEETIKKYSIDIFSIIHIIENVDFDHISDIDNASYDLFKDVSDERLSIYAKFLYKDFDKFEYVDTKVFGSIEKLSPYGENEIDTKYILSYLTFYKNLFIKRNIN